MRAKQNIPIQYQSGNRLPLADCVPLEAPLSLQIETASACNLKCRFCIHGNDTLLKEGRYRSGLMSLDLFKKIVDDLSGFDNKIRYITLHSRGEPLLNPHLPDMVRLLKEAGVVEEVSFNTNGTLLTPELTGELTAAGLDYIRFSIEGVSEEAYRRICGVSVDFHQLVENISYFYKHKKGCHVHVKIVDDGLSEEEQNCFLETFGAVCDDINIEHLADTWKDAGLGNEKAAGASRFTGEDRVDGKVCPRLFFASQIRFDGTVVSCDCDWDERRPFGNVKESSLREIWNGRAYNEFRALHLRGNGNESAICRGCETLHMNYKDYLDDRTAELIRYFT